MINLVLISHTQVNYRTLTRLSNGDNRPKMKGLPLLHCYLMPLCTHCVCVYRGCAHCAWVDEGVEGVHTVYGWMKV